MEVFIKILIKLLRIFSARISNGFMTKKSLALVQYHCTFSCLKNLVMKSVRNQAHFVSNGTHSFVILIDNNLIERAENKQNLDTFCIPS